MGTIECKEEIIGTGYHAAPFVESHGDLSSLSGYKSTGDDHAFLLVKFFLILPNKTSGMTETIKSRKNVPDANVQGRKNLERVEAKI
jgi:hypothetical protein